MIIYALPAVAAAVFISYVAIIEFPEETRAKAVADNELARYRIFVSTADRFFKTEPPPGGLTAYRWENIRIAASPGQEAFGMRSDWKVVRGPDGAWAACTELSPLTISTLNSIYAHAVPDGSKVSHRIQPSEIPAGGGALGIGSGVAVIGVGPSQEALKAATLCDGA